MKKTSLRLTAAALSALMAVSAGGLTISADSESSSSAASQTAFDRSAAPVPKAVCKDGIITLSWNSVDGATSYLVYRSVNGGSFKSVGTVKSLSFTDKNCKAGVEYSYKLCARGKSGKDVRTSEYSKIITISFTKDGDMEKSVTTQSGTYYDEYEDDMVCCGEGVDYEGDVIEETSAAMSEEAGAADYDLHEGVEGEGDVIECEEAAEDLAPAAGEAIDGGDWIEDDDYTPSSKYRGQISAGTLTAGEINDNKGYTDFRRVMNGNDWKYYIKTWDFCPDGRYKIHVTAGGKNAENAVVQLTDKKGSVIFSAKTDNSGTAYVYSKISGQEQSPDKIRVYSPDGKSVQEKSVKDSSQILTEFAFKEKAESVNTLDLMFTVDTTGSMDDELEYLQAEMEDVIKRVSRNNPELDTRVSVNFYRDEDDDYQIRSFAFTDDISKARKQLNDQHSTGGGDTPESVHTAIDNALNEHEWSENSTKLMFLVLDAPPHDYDEVIAEWGELITEAAEQGIRIIPVVSSGADSETEYLMRTAAAITGGRYVFLTDDSGVGYSHAEPDTGAYSVEKLNDLLVRIIEEYVD